MVLTVSFSSATYERIFSSMLRIKTWLRRSMLPDKFSNLSFLQVEREMSNKIFTEFILDVFAKGNRRFS
jgi:hypothetical protein